MSEADESAVKIKRLQEKLVIVERCADAAIKEAHEWLRVWEEAVALRGKVRASLAEEQRRAAARVIVEQAGRDAGMVL